MRNQRFDLDHLTALGAWRHIDERACHGQSPSTQAASVTTTSASSDQNEPSLISAIAITVWVSASRMRLDTAALPARGPSRTLNIFGCGRCALNTWIAWAC